MEPVRNTVFFIERAGELSATFCKDYEWFKTILSIEGYKLVYMPMLNKLFSPTVKEYFTGATNTVTSFSSESLKPLFDKDFWDSLPAMCFVYYFKYEGKYVAIPYTDATSTPGGLTEEMKDLRNAFLKKQKEHQVFESRRFSIGSKKNEDGTRENVHYSHRGEEPVEISRNRKWWKFDTDFARSYLAEEDEEEELLKDLTDKQRLLAYNAQQCIKELKNSGLPLDFILKLIKPNIKLNEIHITKDYRILIPAVNQEIDMVPIEKALYLFFLKHEEGVNFKDLTDYTDEIYQLYRAVSPRWNFTKLKHSVEKLVDPLRNDMNVRTSHIKKIFQLIFEDQIARHYYISGGKGENKRIILDRKLVVWE